MRTGIDMSNNNMKQFIRGAFILTIAGFISKILSAFYRIPIQNLTGDYGFYIYQQIYPFIATVMILALYSFPSAISKLGAELGEKKNKSFHYFLLPVFLILLCMNSLMFIIIYMLAPVIAVESGNVTLDTAYQMIAFSFLIVPFLAIFRGFYQARGTMELTAFSQLIEQIIRVGIIIYVCYFIYIGQIDVYQIGNIGALATVIGMIVASLFLLFIYVNQKKNTYYVQPTNIPWKYYIKTLVFFGLVTAVNHMVFIIIQFGDVFTLIPSLITYGFSTEEAMIWKGIYDRGVPLIQLGIVIGSSFAVALIPVITANKHTSEITVTIQNALALCLYIAGGATVGMMVLFPEINVLFFKDTLGTISLRIFVFTILLISLIVTMNAILQSLGYMYQSVVYIFITFVLKMTLNKLLIPYFGLPGASFATVISLSILWIITIFYLKRAVPSTSLFAGVKGPVFIVANVMMASYLMICKHLFTFALQLSRVSLFFYVISLVVTGAILYFIILLRYKAFQEEQIDTFPFSSYVRKLAHVIGSK